MLVSVRLYFSVAVAVARRICDGDYSLASCGVHVPFGPQGGDRSIQVVQASCCYTTPPQRSFDVYSGH